MAEERGEGTFRCWGVDICFTVGILVPPVQQDPASLPRCVTTSGVGCVLGNVGNSTGDEITLRDWKRPPMKWMALQSSTSHVCPMTTIPVGKATLNDRAVLRPGKLTQLQIRPGLRSRRETEQPA